MANLKERREQEDAWQSFADHLGCDLDDVKVQTNAALLGDKRDKKIKTAMSAEMRNRILERTEWKNEPVKPGVVAKIGGTG